MLNNSDIRTFAATISRQQLGLALHRPLELGNALQCFGNATRSVELEGSKVRFGWVFQHRLVQSIPGPGYLIAVHHAVWHAPNGQLVDVTPFAEDPKQHPLGSGGDVLFLVDDRALPVATDYLIAPLPSRFFPLTADEELVAYVASLFADEKKIYVSPGRIDN